MQRFIPASAGNTFICAMDCQALPVHPRVCGEHALLWASPDCKHGSSPRLRGTRHRVDARHGRGRFIPASAGNTTCWSMAFLIMAVHPRVCGEHMPDLSRSSSENGSSPRLRGTRSWQDGRQLPPRFIPASAGNTSNFSNVNNGASVHPRVCGEHSLALRSTISSAGSSPRLRGTHTGVA